MTEDGTQSDTHLLTTVQWTHRRIPQIPQACIGKQLQRGLEWDDLVWKATAAYNFFPTESSGFSPFFLMYGREANAKHMILAEETTKYLGDNEGVLNVQLMMKLYRLWYTT